MTTSIVFARAAALLLVGVLAAGCASRPGQPVHQPMPGTIAGTQYGVVQNITSVRAPGRPSGAGALVGGMVGAVVGRQIDRGDGRDLATAVGVVAGAIIGNEIERNSSGHRDVYRVTVRVDRGVMRSFDYEQLNDLRVGDRVRIENNQLYRW